MEGMQNAECWMQNWGICFADDLKPCRRHTFILHFAFWISHFPDAGKAKNNPIPWRNQGWDTKYSTVPPWLRPQPSLIGTVTGAPVRPFPTGGSEVVSIRAGVQMPFTLRHPLWESYRDRMSSSQLFTFQTYHKFSEKSMLNWKNSFWGPKSVVITSC